MTNTPVFAFHDTDQHSEKISPQAIILAGGLGTRLRAAVPDLPKCMAPVNGRPFLFYVINYLRSQDIDRFIFSLGYMHEMVEEYLAEHFPTLKYSVVIEDEPLGTGGAIQLACRSADTDTVIIANGDTLYKANLNAALNIHEQHASECTLLLKPMQQFDRYGVVQANDKGTITGFQEKKFYEEGTINAGLYILNKAAFLSKGFPGKFSFEKDYLEPASLNGTLSACIQDVYFIDIGIPTDFQKAQSELAPAPLDLKAIDKSWTLFLDRDGVINEDKLGSYIFNPEEFIFTKGAPELFKTLSEKFARIIIITNQRGVGRNLMTEKDLAAIHEKMCTEVESAGGHIDGIYYCSSIHNDHSRRKPNPGMAISARNDFPGLDLSKTIMAGNNMSDMHFARNAGVYAVFIRSTRPDQPLPNPDIDLAFDSLADFAKALQNP